MPFHHPVIGKRKNQVLSIIYLFVHRVSFSSNSRIVSVSYIIVNFDRQSSRGERKRTRTISKHFFPGTKIVKKKRIMKHGRMLDTWMEGEGTDLVARERGMPGLAYFGGWAFLPLANRQFLSRPPHCPAIRPAILFARQNAHDRIRTWFKSILHRRLTRNWKLSPRTLDSTFFFYLLSLAHHINNKIVLTTRLFIPRCVLESRGSRRSSTPIRTDPIFTGRSYNVCSGVVSWVEREGRRRRRKLREKEPWFERFVEIYNIGGGRNAWSWKESDSWEGGGRMRVFHPHRFHHHHHHHTATDPVPVSDIKWSRACKLSHSVAEAPILASSPKKPSTNQHSTSQSTTTESRLHLPNGYSFETGMHTYFLYSFVSLFRDPFEFRFFGSKDNGRLIVVTLRRLDFSPPPSILNSRYNRG